MKSRTGRRLHLVGIGGSGMSSLAAYLLERGDAVSGSDARDGSVLDRLRGRGARIFRGHSAEHLEADLDEVIYTAAVGDDHPELAEARRRGVPVAKYATFLGGELAGMRAHGVAGTHGKTTTSGLLAGVLEHAGLDPSAVVGGFARDWELPGRCGGGRDFVVEACEYDHSFLRLRPQNAIVTNVEADHLEYFGDLAGVVTAFQEFLAGLPADGLAILHQAAALRLDLGRIRARPIVVGEGEGVTDRLVRLPVQQGRERARLEVEGYGTVMLRPAQPGVHNLWNAALAAALAVRLGAAAVAVETAVREFGGMRRRLEPLGHRGGVFWYSDYAHHPTEVRAAREALRGLHPGRRLLLVFQPHQVCRTAFFRTDFARELAAFDQVIVPGIFAAREAPEKISRETELLLQAVRDSGGSAEQLDGLSHVPGAVQDRAREGDVVILMGAGDIDDLAEPLRQTAREVAVA